MTSSTTHEERSGYDYGPAAERYTPNVADATEAQDSTGKYKDSIPRVAPLLRVPYGAWLPAAGNHCALSGVMM